MIFGHFDTCSIRRRRSSILLLAMRRRFVAGVAFDWLAGVSLVLGVASALPRALLRRQEPPGFSRHSPMPIDYFSRHRPLIRDFYGHAARAVDGARPRPSAYLPCRRPLIAVIAPRRRL